MKRYESWGRYPKVRHAGIVPIFWRSDPPRLGDFWLPVLSFGQGRSYGDTCLNDGGILIDTESLCRFISFDEDRGIIRCEAGVTMADLLDLIVPRGWFLPVTPGTKYVSIGGAIAHDVHGKNHHKAGTFGCYVKSFQLLRSNGRPVICSVIENADLYKATIGGMGLTGLILWAEIQLKSISSPFIAMERIRFADLEEFFELATLSDRDYEYTAAWVDCLARGKNFGRGIFIRGDHADGDRSALGNAAKQRTIRLLCDVPALFVNRLTIKAANAAYYFSQFHKTVKKVVPYDSFFYPLDAVLDWNRMYGRRGFLQYQCVVPDSDDHKAIREILARVALSGSGSFLTVLKVFGTVPSPGMLSFPRAGVTLTLDFPYGLTTLQLLDKLDEIVCEAGGAVYPAKDARMSPKSFQGYFPQWREFAHFIDPKFSSSFWRRVAVSPGEDGA